MSNCETCILFICQPGELEVKSLILAYSLRKKLPQNQQIVVVIPEDTKEQLSEQTLLLFSKLSIECVFFTNPYIRIRQNVRPGDWMSNKFYSLLSLNNNKEVLFLDSDIICLNNFDVKMLSNHSLAAKPADKRLDLDWKLLYGQNGLKIPESTVVTTVDLRVGFPYFNTGVLYIKNSNRQEFCKAWRNYFLSLSDEDRLWGSDFEVFHRDQIAFSLALQKTSSEIFPLDESLNYPIRLRKTMNSKATFIHYHDVYTLAKYHELRAFIKTFFIEHPEFRILLKNETLWFLAGNNRCLILSVLHFLWKGNKFIRRNFNTLRIARK